MPGTVVLAISFFMLSCSKDEAGTTPADNTITGKVTSDASLSLFEKAMIKAGLNTTLSGTGPFTVFAPDDAAFAVSGITSASIDAMTTDDIKKLLLYHTLTSKIMAADMPAGPNAKILTANSPVDSVFVTKNSAGIFVNGIKVTAVDIAASNGVIHKLEKALLYPKANMVATVQASSGGDNGLDSLARAITIVNLASPGLIALLNSNVLTVFAPTNKAFRDLLAALPGAPASLNDIPVATLGAALSYHVVPGRVFSANLANGSLTMFAGGNTTINLTNGSGGGPTITGNGNAGLKSNIVAINIMSTNGVLHVIDRVLLP